MPHFPSFRSSFVLFRVPFFTPVLLAILSAMLAEAMAFSYIAMLAVDPIGMTPVELGAFLSLSAISGIIVTTLFDHLHDRRPATWPLLLSLLAKVAALAICGMATQTWVLLLNAAVLFGISSASYALLFAMAKSYLDGHDEQTTSSGMAALRMSNSLSWAVGPALGTAMGAC